MSFLSRQTFTIPDYCLCSADYAEAVGYYTEALKVYPPACEQEIAVCYANRGACHMKLVQTTLIRWIDTQLETMCTITSAGGIPECCR